MFAIPHIVIQILLGVLMFVSYKEDHALFQLIIMIFCFGAAIVMSIVTIKDKINKLY